VALASLAIFSSCPPTPISCTGLSASVNARLAASGTRINAAVGGEMDTRLGALGESVELRVRELQVQMDQLAASKADTASMNQYTAQVSLSAVQTFLLLSQGKYHP
jgi:hypothetical protein